MYKSKKMNRIQSIDTIRLIAIFAVIAIHTTPFQQYHQSSNEFFKVIFVIVNQLSRFAVPFFFVISGYLWGLKIRNGDDPILITTKTSKKLLFIFIVWCIIYILPYDFISLYRFGILGEIKVSYLNLLALFSHPINLIMQGTRGHLWFLIGLLFSLWISSLFIKHKKSTIALLCFSLLLYIIAVLAKAYVNTPIGINLEVNGYVFNMRNGPFFGTIFFVTGYIFSAITITTKWFFYGLLIFTCGCILHLSEVYVLWKYFNTSPLQDFVFGTYFMGIGVAMVSLSNHKVLSINALSKLGQVTLGVYLIHLIYVDILKHADFYLSSFLWEISKTPIVLLLSILSVSFISKNRISKKIIM